MAIYKKKASVGAFLKKGQDFKEGELLTIASQGKQILGQFGEQDVFLMKLGNGTEGNLSINQTSLNNWIDAWGEDATKWIGKQVKTTKIKQNVAGKFLDVWYFAHPDAELTEDGFVMPGAQNVKVEPERNDYQNEPEEEGVDVSGIPF